MGGDTMNGGRQSMPRPAIAQPHVALLSGLLRALNRALLSDSHLSRIVRRPIWSVFYGAASRNLEKGPTTFMNWGFLGDGDEPARDDSLGVADLVSKRLYDAVIDDVDLTGRAVIEVGCGAGAGSAHVAATRQPALLTAIDFSKGLIALCQAHHKMHNLRFVRGDALDLPIADDSVDVVVNVESSHCYPSRLRFFEEVARVLRPGGTFLLADGTSSEGKAEDAELVSRHLQEAGLLIEACVDITANVLAARDAVSRSRSFRANLESSNPSMTLQIAEEALCLPGTKMYEDLAARRVQYFRWKAAKPGAVPPDDARNVSSGLRLSR